MGAVEINDTLGDSKGLTSSNDLGVFPLGKKGEVKVFEVGDGNVTMDYGSAIKDNDRRNIITCISYAIKTLGYDNTKKIKAGAKLKQMSDEGQVLYTTFSVKASELSKILYDNTREGRLVAKSLKSAMKITVDVADGKNVFNQLNNIVYKHGYITFSVANFLVNHIASTILPFRIGSTLMHKDFNYRLSFYIETNQYSKGKGKWFPKNTYSLDELLDGLNLRGTYEDRENKHCSKDSKRV